MTAITLGSLAAVLFWLGRWGRTHAASLVPHALPERDRARREGTLRRGAIACQVAAALLLIGAAASLLP